MTPRKLPNPLDVIFDKPERAGQLEPGCLECYRCSDPLPMWEIEFPQRTMFSFTGKLFLCDHCKEHYLKLIEQLNGVLIKLRNMEPDCDGPFRAMPLTATIRIWELVWYEGERPVNDELRSKGIKKRRRRRAEHKLGGPPMLTFIYPG